MQNLTKIRSFSLAVCGCLALAIGAPVFAQHSGGGGHGSATVSGGGHGGATVSGGSGGYRGGYYGGYRGGYYGGYRGGYYGGYRGYYGGYGYRGWYGGYYPWGWGAAGLGLGLYFATLPYYYSTYWYGGVPYYYADNTYYQWDGAVGQYQTVSPPPNVQNQPAGQAGSAPELIAYPKNGQSLEQQGKDKFECYQWAVSQTGFDPTQAGGGAAPAKQSDYYRAQSACLEGRGYSVK
jgi:hypothetical protein